MKILFDSQIFDSQKYGGISRYFSELFCFINNSKEVECSLFIRDTNNEYLKKISPFFNTSSPRERILFNLNTNFIIWRLFRKIFIKIYEYLDYNSNLNQSKRALINQNFDIFHPTYYSTYFLKYLKNKPLVVTVYDMIHEIYPEYFFLDNNKTIKQKRKIILRADKIIAISENTKKDIIRFYDIPENKIEVIYLGNSLSLIEKKALAVKDIPDRYILFVGARGGYKNFLYFLKSVSQLLNTDKGLHLIVAGGYSGKNFFSDKERKVFIELNIEKQIKYYSVNDEDLAHLYRNAICFIFPTLYEGFGIPVLEAFACDCPAVISNTSSLPEVGGDAVVYFNPTVSSSILKSVKEVVYDKKLRDDLIIRGREQLKKFSWEKTAKETIKLYLSIK